MLRGQNFCPAPAVYPAWTIGSVCNALRKMRARPAQYTAARVLNRFVGGWLRVSLLGHLLVGGAEKQYSGLQSQQELLGPS